MNNELKTPEPIAGVLAFLLCFLAGNVHAIEKDPIFIIKAPPGFDEVLEQERTFIDVFYLNKKIGSTLANYENQSIIFEDPQGLAALVHELRDHEKIIDALSQPLNQHRELHCDAQVKIDNCGYLETEVAGVIFYPQKLEAHLFIIDRFTYSRDSRARYLPPPTTSAGLIIGTNSRGIYDNDHNNLTGNTRLNIIAGRGRYSFTSDMYADWDDNSQLQAATLNYTGKQTEFKAGFLPYANGSTLARSSRLMGLRIATTLNTRLDKESLTSVAIPIQITGSAVIEVLREGRVLDIQRVENGQSMLDTRRLPGGSYDITLRITENGVSREEIRYFSKGSNLPPIDNAQWFMEMGYPTQSSGQGRFAPRLNEELQFSAGVNKRISPKMGLNAQLAASELDQYAEVSTFFQLSSFNGQFGYIHSADDDYGFFSRVSMHNGNWQMSANYREINAEQERGVDLNAAYDPFPQSFKQGGLSATYRFPSARLGLRGFYRQTRDLPESYFGGPYLEWDVLKKRKSRLTFFAQAETGSDRESYYAGLRFSSFGRSLSFNGNANVRLDEPEATGIQTTREIIETDLRYANSQQSRFYNQVTAGLRHERFDNGLGYDAEFGARAGLLNRSPWAEFGVDARDNYQGQNNILTSLVSSLVIAGGNFSFTPRQQDSGVLVTIDGNDDTEFDLVANGSKRKRLVNGSSAYVPLPSYAIHDVGIRPVGTTNVEYDHQTDRIVTYPGNIPIVKRKANRVVIVVGQIVDKKGDPLSDVSLYAGKFLGFTDSEGNFQFDLGNQEELDVRKQSESICKIRLITQSQASVANSEFVNLGKLVCQ